MDIATAEKAVSLVDKVIYEARDNGVTVTKWPKPMPADAFDFFTEAIYTLAGHEWNRKPLPWLVYAGVRIERQEAA